MNGVDFKKRYGPWALITGASSGIGERFAEDLAASGLSLVLVARRRNLLEQLAQRLAAQHGVECRVIDMDLLDVDAAGRLAAQVTDIDLGLLVNNAGSGWIGRFDLAEATEHRGLIQLHCTLPAELTARLLPSLKRRGHSGIIFVSSVAAFVPVPYYAVYGGTKAFLLLWGEALAEELDGSGVDVQILAPGDTKTGFQEVAGEMSTRWSSVESVVGESLQGLGSKRIVIPGLENKAGVFAARLLPRSWMARITKARQRAQTPPERR